MCRTVGVVLHPLTTTVPIFGVFTSNKLRNRIEISRYISRDFVIEIRRKQLFGIEEKTQHESTLADVTSWKVFLQP